MNFPKTSTLKSFAFKKKSRKLKNFKTVAIAGNPNVGKSTVFNALTGLKQHTGNWPGKTVERAEGTYFTKFTEFKIVDIPGTYSLMANSPEEEIARNFICFQKPDAVIVVMDATCMERNLNLTLQILELTKNVVICINLMDEAKRKNIFIDKDELSLQLGGVPIVFTNARSGKGIARLMEETEKISTNKIKTFNIKNNYKEEIEKSIEKIQKNLPENSSLDNRWLSIKLLENNEEFKCTLENHAKKEIEDITTVIKTAHEERIRLKKLNISSENLKDSIVESIIKKSENIYKLCVKTPSQNHDITDRKIDKFLTSRLTGFPTMILLLLVIFWITLSGANYPSEIISKNLFAFENEFSKILFYFNAPSWAVSLVISGIYRTLAWVVSVMLPPMAIFFPLFTLLEDVGYLPRIAFNLDNVFKKCGAHGKQSLTMCMSFGCNACGIIGSKIIDSPRERLIAILTNNFVPCNGRFPILISIISMFFIANFSAPTASFLSSIMLTLVILFGIGITFLSSKLLSLTLLRGMPSSFVLELPPYRKPQIGKVLIRSLLDRTIFVLGRAIAVAAPAGLIIWIMANTFINNSSILGNLCEFLNPLGKMMGMDGTILMAFILGFPANEIVFPIIIMSYMCTESISATPNTSDLYTLLVSHGWTYITAICVMIFSLMHFPCGTTMQTIKKETGSRLWTALAFIIPTVLGIITCFTVANLLRIFQR